MADERKIEFVEPPRRDSAPVIATAKVDSRADIIATKTPISIYSSSKKCLTSYTSLSDEIQDVSPEDALKIGLEKQSALSLVGDARVRFTAWAKSIAALHPEHLKSSLDARLKDAKEIRESVLRVLSDLQFSLDTASLIVTGERPNKRWSLDSMSDDEDDDDEEDSDEEEDEDEDEESDDESENLPSVAEGLNDSGDQVDVPERWTSELDELFSAIEFSNASLMRFSIVIRISPARDDYLKAAARYNYDNSFKIFYINHVRDKHGATMGDREWLIQRMGTAITRRKQYLTYRKEHQGKLSRDWDEEEHDVKPGGKREHTVALTQATDYEEKKKLDEVHEVEEKEGSFGSVTSYENTVVGEASQKRTVPPPPPMAFEGIPFEYGEPFQCPYCYTEQIVQNRQAWKSHVFKDLKPYVCTFKECDLKMFRSRNEWFAHELQNHRREWSCISCRDIFANKPKFQTHLINVHKVENESQLKAMIAQSEEPVDKILPSACLFCENWEADLLHSRHDATRTFLGNGEKIKPTGSLGQFRRHLGHHLEQLALFALPINEGDDVQDDSDDEDGSEKDSLDASKAGSDVILKALAELKAVDSQDSEEELPFFDAPLDTSGEVPKIHRSSDRFDAQYIDSSENLVTSRPGSPLESEGSVRRTFPLVTDPIDYLDIADVTAEVPEIATTRSTHAREAVDNINTRSQPTEYTGIQATHVPMEPFKPVHNEAFERIREELSQAKMDAEIQAQKTQGFEDREESDAGKTPDDIESETGNESMHTAAIRGKLSRTERLAAYAKARDRIFGKGNEYSELTDDSDDSTESSLRTPAKFIADMVIEDGNPREPKMNIPLVDLETEKYPQPEGANSGEQETSHSSPQTLNLDSRQSLAYSGAKVSLPSPFRKPKKSRKSKMSRACDECQRRKIICDAVVELGGNVPCSSCKRANATCHFSGVAVNREPSKGYIKELAARVNQLEGEIQKGEIPRGPQDESMSPGMTFNALDEREEDASKESRSEFLAPSRLEPLKPYPAATSSRAPTFDGASDLGPFEDDRGESGNSTPNYYDDFQFEERLYPTAEPSDEPTVPVPVYEEVITHYRDFDQEAILNSQQTTLDADEGDGTPKTEEGTSHDTIVENNHPQSGARQTTPDQKGDTTTPVTKGLSSMKHDKKDLLDKFFSVSSDAGTDIKPDKSQEMERSERDIAGGDEYSELLEQAIAHQEEADRNLRLTGDGLVSSLASAHRPSEGSLDRGEDGDGEGKSLEREIPKLSSMIEALEESKQARARLTDSMKDLFELDIVKGKLVDTGLAHFKQDNDIGMNEVERSGDRLRDPGISSRNISGDEREDKGKGKNIEQDTVMDTKSPPPRPRGRGVITDKQSPCQAPGCKNLAMRRYSHCSNHMCFKGDCDNLRPSGLGGPYCPDHREEGQNKSQVPDVDVEPSIVAQQIEHNKQEVEKGANSSTPNSTSSALELLTRQMKEEEEKFLKKQSRMEDAHQQDNPPSRLETPPPSRYQPVDWLEYGQKRKQEYEEDRSRRLREEDELEKARKELQEHRRERKREERERRAEREREREHQIDVELDRAARVRQRNRDAAASQPDGKKKTSYYDYADERSLSQADAKLFYQRSQMESTKPETTGLETPSVDLPRDQGKNDYTYDLDDVEGLP